MNKDQLDAVEREKDKDEISFLKQLMSERLGPKWDRLTIYEARKDRAKDLAADAVIKRIEVEGMADLLERLIGDGESADGIARVLRDYLMEGK